MCCVLLNSNTLKEIDLEDMYWSLETYPLDLT